VAAGAGDGATGSTWLAAGAVCRGVSGRIGLILGAAGALGTTGLGEGLGLGTSLIGARVGCGAGWVGACGGGGGLVGAGVGEGGGGLVGVGVGLVGAGVGAILTGVVGSLIGAGVGGILELVLICEKSGMFRGSKSSFIVPAGRTTLEGTGEALIGVGARDVGAGDVGAGVEPVKKVVPGRAVLDGTGLTVVGAPEGAALLLSWI